MMSFQWQTIYINIHKSKNINPHCEVYIYHHILIFFFIQILILFLKLRFSPHCEVHIYIVMIQTSLSNFVKHSTLLRLRWRQVSNETRDCLVWGWGGGKEYCQATRQASSSRLEVEKTFIWGWGRGTLHTNLMTSYLPGSLACRSLRRSIGVRVERVLIHKYL